MSTSNPWFHREKKHGRLNCATGDSLKWHHGLYATPKWQLFLFATPTHYSQVSMATISFRFTPRQQTTVSLKRGPRRGRGPRRCLSLYRVFGESPTQRCCPRSRRRQLRQRRRQCRTRYPVTRNRQQKPVTVSWISVCQRVRQWTLVRPGTRNKVSLPAPLYRSLQRRHRSESLQMTTRSWRQIRLPAFKHCRDRVIYDFCPG